MQKTILAAFASAMIFSVGAAHANETGIITLSGKVGNGTCTVAGIDGSLMFDEVTAATVEATTPFSPVTQKDIPITLSACASGITKAKLVTTWNYDVNAEYPEVDGDMEGMTLFYYASPSDPYGTRIKSGDTQTIDITNGGGSKTLQARMIRDSRAVVSGDYSSTLNMAMTYE
ncbi:fimbrial protein [Pantoea sp. SGAir0175]